MARVGSRGNYRDSGPIWGLCKKTILSSSNSAAPSASFTSPSSSTSSPSKLDKAKSTCTELGFTAGTEKHGECVLKVMDN